jgi:hypothetical protein
MEKTGMRTALAALAVLLIVPPLTAEAQKLTVDTPSLFGRRKPPPDDSLPPPPFLSKPGPEAAKPVRPGSEVRAKTKTACRTVTKRATVEGRTVTKRERVCG